MSQAFDHIVIGAGISGLGAAHLSARKGFKTLVLEASERIGGCIHSLSFAALGGFWVEAGGHTCFNSYGNLLSILDDLGLTQEVKPKPSLSYKLWRDGQRCSILSALHPLEALGSLPRIFKEPKAGRNVRDYYSAILGSRNYQDLLRHAFQAVICQPADDYPAEVLFRRKPRRKDVVKAFTFDRGISTIPEAIAAQNGLEVRTGQRIERIERHAAGFQVELADGQILDAAYLTLAVPPDAAAQLLPRGFEALRDLVARIPMSELETLVLVFRREDLKALKPFAGLIGVEAPFYSAVSRDFLPDGGYRGLAFHFRPVALTLEEQLQVACAALGVGPEQVIAKQRVHNRLPALRAGHLGLVEQIDRALAGERLGMTGNWFIGISMEDALTRSRLEHRRLFGG
ncbi:FAD-dependent oxidoreductase [Caldichromatium japonicum]|uniref:FAD-dependent oxidoreductase n=1 Tax=Caldichromatium japonicum TaxID=2699430 RepID=A0A6G7VB73_9GAMM|nr:FAD-dependent oxidoreductase [Caldichromatium japonicum]QIK37323.1 FAD-dependent oxidoreductase [Caldichromatium japonicum]